MSRFIETIKIQDETPPDLSDHIQVPDNFKTGTARCRVLFSRSIEKITYASHIRRIVTTLKMVVDDGIDYSFKYADRQRLETLLRKQPDKNGDILIIKNGFVTDTSYSNIVFHDGSRWVTPDTPLLAGTQRHKLIHEGIITEARITPDDLNRFKKARLINALLEFDGEDIDIDQIVW